MMKKVKTIYMALLAMLAVSTVTSCDSTEGLSDTTKTEVANNLFKIADFPGSFNEGKSTRTVGTPDAGKTAWADGDVIYLRCDVYDGFSGGACTGNVKDTYVYSLTRASSAWQATQLSTNTKSLFYYQGQNAGVRVNAYYAPNYDFKAGILTLKTGKIEGTAEFLTYTKDEAIADMGSANPISLTRDYARIRMHAPAGMQVTLKEASDLFVPAEGGWYKRSDKCYTTTADANGNAFFYGTWTKGTGDLTFYAVAKDGDTEYNLSHNNNSDATDSYTLSASSTANKGYVMDAYPISYEAMGNGRVANPYLIVTKEQMIDVLETSNTAFSKDYNFKLCRDIDMGGYSLSDKSGDFEGVFDGNFHTISNYTHTQGDKYWGLFPRVTGGFDSSQGCTWGIIKNLTVCPISSTDPDPNNSPASKGDYAGALVGYLYKGAVMNCKVIVADGHYIKYLNDNYSDRSFFGGLIGKAVYSYIIECASQGSFTTTSYGSVNDKEVDLGGLVGNIGDTYIGHCYVDVSLHAYSTAGTDKNHCEGLGGIVGYVAYMSSDYTSFEGCYAKTSLIYDKWAGGGVANNQFVGVFAGDLGLIGAGTYDYDYSHCYAYQLSTTDTFYNYFATFPNTNSGNYYDVSSGKREFVTSEDQTLVGNLNSTSMSATTLYNNEKLKTELNKNQGFKLVGGKVRLKWE